jgi:hypothetical protein
LDGPAAIFGALVGAVGWLLLKSASGPYQICHIVGSLHDLASALPGAQTSPPSSCSTVDHRFFAAVGVAAAGGILTLVTLIAMARRAGASRRAGSPWWLHTAPGRLAAWLDRRLPGKGPADGSARITGELVTALGIALLVGAVALGSVGWNKLSGTLEARAHHRGQIALAALALPTQLDVKANPSCQPSPDRLCASSSLPPAQVEPMLQQLLHGKPNAQLCGMLPTPDDAPCPVYGKLGGYRAMAIAFNHLVVIHQGKPPPGATPVRPGSTHLFYRGTDISISLLTPNAT